MRCLCEHYLETASGYCCLERQRLLDQNAELKEELARAKAEIKRLRAEGAKTPMEAQFEEGAPSSQRLKKTSPEERVARRGGAKDGHGSQGEGGLRTREVLGSVLLTLRLRHGRDAWKVLVAALDKLAADPKTDIVKELFPEYDPAKDGEAKTARPA